MDDLNGAIKNLTEHQKQLDADGCMVGVSRQALDELITAWNTRAVSKESLHTERIKVLEDALRNITCYDMGRTGEDATVMYEIAKQALKTEED